MGERERERAGSVSIKQVYLVKKLITNPDMIITSFNTPPTLREREREKREKDREIGREREREGGEKERGKEEEGRGETGREKERFIHSVTQSVSPFKLNY